MTAYAAEVGSYIGRMLTECHRARARDCLCWTRRLHLRRAQPLASIFIPLRHFMDDVRKASNLKRRKDSDPDLKLKHRKTGELQPQAGPSRSKPRTRRVHRVTPCPTDCLPSSPKYAFHRQKLVTRITAQLRADGRVVHEVLFFEDGVAFDWVLNNSVKTRPK